MLRNYLKIALRSLVKNKVFTLINVFGLFIGLTAFLMIYAYVDFEKSYDQYHADADRIYRVTTDNVVNGGTVARDAMSFSPLGKAMKAELPQVAEYTTSMQLYEDLVFMQGDEFINESGVVAVDENFLKIFSYKVLHGEESPFKEPKSLVLTRSGAKRLFGKENPVGETVEVFGIHKGNYKITAVLEDVPSNTHYKFDVMISFATIQDRADEDGWRGMLFYTYVKLNEGANPEDVQAGLDAFPKKYLRADLPLEFTMQPMADIHLTAGISYEPEPVGNAQTIHFLLMIAVFIIVIAWVNYVNLSTARAMDRAKEVGLRKVVGAVRWQLIVQFMMESILINLLAAILALTVLQIVAPVYNNLLGNNLINSVWTNGDLIRILVMITLSGAFLSGFYPSLIMSSFKPIVALRGKLRNSRQGLILRKSLVVFQFVASLVLIAGTAIVFLQIKYMKNRDLGVNIDQVLTLRIPAHDEVDSAAYQQKYQRLRTELTRNPSIDMVATASSIPGGGRSNIGSSGSGVSIIGETRIEQSTLYMTDLDEYFFPTMEVDLLAGRNFSSNRKTESKSVIINQEVLKRIGYTKEPETVLNKRLRIGGANSERIFNVIGVVNNYNRRSLKDELEPTIYFQGYDSFTTNLVVKLNSTDLNAAVEAIKAEWQILFPNAPFEYSFMDQQFDKAYKEDQQFGSLFATFSALAMAIAGLGLFGLSSFIALQRSKEIGVRKVLGASVANIVRLISKDFLRLVVLALLVGSPLVWFIMDSWLNNYAFRIDMPVWILPMAGGVLLLITLVTVGYQTTRAASANPINALRSE